MLTSHLWDVAGTALFLGISWFPGYEMPCSVCRTKLQVKQETNAPDHKQLVWDCVQDGRNGYCACEGQFSLYLPGHTCFRSSAQGQVAGLML